MRGSDDLGDELLLLFALECGRLIGNHIFCSAFAYLALLTRQRKRKQISITRIKITPLFPPESLGRNIFTARSVNVV
jgi:hypothetical protein